MSSEGIKVPCKLWPHRSTNANATYDTMVATVNGFIAEGIKCADNVLSDVLFKMAAPIPTNVHGTPNAKLRLVLLTPITGTSNFKMQRAFQILARGVTSVDFTPSFSSGTVASAGQYIETVLDFALTGTYTAGFIVEGVIRRDGGDAADQIAGDVFIVEALIVLDDTV